MRKGERIPFQELNHHQKLSGEPHLFHAGIRNDSVIRELYDEYNGQHFDVKTATEFAHKVKLQFDELHSKYGITTPTSFVVGNNEEGNIATFAITEFIKGDNVNTLVHTDSSIDESLKTKFAEHYLRLLHYLDEKVGHQERMLYDIYRSDQYIYGSRETDEEKEFYLVDSGANYTETLHVRWCGLILMDITQELAELYSMHDLRFPDVEQSIATILSTCWRINKNDDNPTQQKNNQEILSKTNDALKVLSHLKNS